MKRIAAPIFAFCCGLLAFANILPYGTGEKGEGVIGLQESSSEAMDALNFWTLQRAYPQPVIPDDQYYAAFEKVQQNTKSPFRKSSRSEQWRSIGPHNIGGRTLAVVFNPQNPNTIYAGSASGGLWRSRSAGLGKSAWEYVATGYPVLGVNSIAIMPNDSNTILIGTGEVYGYQNSIGGIGIRTTRGSYGIGILKTSDGGKSWKKSLDWSYNQRRGVQAVRIHPIHPNIIWAGTTEGVYKSLDTGATWKQVHNVVMATDIALNPLDTNIAFVACGNLSSPGAGIYRSTDGGLAWIKLSAGLPAPFGGKIWLTMYQASPNVIFASIGAGSDAGTWLCRTTNNGDTWSTVSTFDYSTYQGWYSHFVGVNPTDSSKILCGGVDLYKSTNGGLTLQKKSDWSAWYLGRTLPGDPEGPLNYSHADHHTIAYYPQHPDTIYFGNDGGVFRTTDGGETFQGCNGGYQTVQFYNGFSSAVTDSALSFGGLQDNASAIYEGTDAWRRVIGGDGCMTAIHPSNPNTIYGTSQNLNLLRSTNRGTSWSGISPPSSTYTNFVGPYVLSRSQPQVLYAGRDKVFKSTNGGTNWTALNNSKALDGNPLLSLAVSSTNPDTVYATTAPQVARSGVFVSTNGGSAWQNITGNLPDRFMIDIIADPVNSATVYLTLSGFGSSHLFKSTDTGQNWIDIGASLPDVPTSAVIVDPLHRDHLYAGNDIGVFYSSDAGGNWQKLSDGLPDAAIVMDLSISPSNRALRAATHGNGAYERSLVEPVTGVGSQPQIVSDFRLEQNYPNPFNPSTNLRFTIAKLQFVQLNIVDELGRDVAVLVNEQKSPGSYSVIWNAAGFSSGVYFCRLSVGGLIETKKMLLVK